MRRVRRSVRGRDEARVRMRAVVDVDSVARARRRRCAAVEIGRDELAGSRVAVSIMHVRDLHLDREQQAESQEQHHGGAATDEETGRAHSGIR